MYPSIFIYSWDKELDLLLKKDQVEEDWKLHVI